MAKDLSAQNVMMIHGITVRKMAEDLNVNYLTIKRFFDGHTAKREDRQGEILKYLARYDRRISWTSMLDPSIPDLEFNLPYAIRKSGVNPHKFATIFRRGNASSYLIKYMKEDKLSIRQAHKAFNAICEAGYEGSIERLLVSRV